MPAIAAAPVCSRAKRAGGLSVRSGPRLASIVPAVAVSLSLAGLLAQPRRALAAERCAQPAPSSPPDAQQTARPGDAEAPADAEPTAGGAPPPEEGTPMPSALEADARTREGPAAPSEPEATPTAAESLGRTAKRVKCLDETLVDEFGRSQARKGVQPRFFRKALRAVVSLGGGVYAGDLFDTQWQAGANVGFWIAEDFGIDADFKLTPRTFRFERAATNTINGQNRYPDGVAANLAYVTMAHLLWAPMHTKLRSSEERIIHGDFVLFGGGGVAFHDAIQGIGVELGMSLYLYPTKYMSVRFDLSDQIFAEEAFGSRRISNNLVFSTGIGLWIPFRMRD